MIREYKLLEYGAVCDGNSPIQDSAALQRIETEVRAAPATDTKVVIFPAAPCVTTLLRRRSGTQWLGFASEWISDNVILTTDSTQPGLVENAPADHGKGACSLFRVVSPRNAGRAIQVFEAHYLRLDGRDQHGFVAGEQSHAFSVESVKGLRFSHLDTKNFRSDGIAKMLGRADAPTEDFEIYDCRTQDNRRSAVAVQRWVRRGSVKLLKSISCTDQIVDFEPTGPADEAEGPRDILFEDIEISHGKYSASLVFSIGGIGGDTDPDTLGLARNITLRRVSGPDGTPMQGGIRILRARDTVLDTVFCMSPKFGLELYGASWNTQVRNSEIGGAEAAIKSSPYSGGVVNGLHIDSASKLIGPTKLDCASSVSFAKGFSVLCGAPAINISNQVPGRFASGILVDEPVLPAMGSAPIDVTLFVPSLLVRVANVRSDCRVDGVIVRSHPIEGVTLLDVDPKVANRVSAVVVTPVKPSWLWWESVDVWRRAACAFLAVCKEPVLWTGTPAALVTACETDDAAAAEAALGVELFELTYAQRSILE